MKKHVIFIILSILSIHNIFAKKTTTKETDPIDLRIRHLKHQLHEILGGNKDPDETDLNKEMSDYVDNSNKPITPISEHDQRKLEGRYKQPELKTTSTPKYVASPETVEKEPPLRSEKKKKKKKQPHKTGKKPHVEIFYRRNMVLDVANDMNKPQKWMHCLDLLSPYMNGYLHNISSKRIEATDGNIRRLSYLLTLNMTGASTEDIKATLYEISNLPLRIYQWDVSAVKTIIRSIVKDKPHDFKGLKYGFKELFNSWKLNTSNLTRLLSQSRIFRPPCIQITNYAGSTASQKVNRYTTASDIENKNNNNKNTYAMKEEDC